MQKLISTCTGIVDFSQGSGTGAERSRLERDQRERDSTSLDLRPAVIPSGCKSRLSIDERDMEEFQLETEMGETAEPSRSQEAHSESTRA